MKNRQAFLKEILAIRRMERGTLCPMRQGPSGAYYNHQSWEQGRNRVRYVPAAQAAELRAAIDGYRRFLSLTQAYADAIIQQTRRAWQDPKLGEPGGKRRRTPTGDEPADGRSRAREARRRAAPRAGGRA